MRCSAREDGALTGALGDPAFWAVQALNGLQYAMLLFLISVGLTVVFGLMGFVNLAHGGFYAVGAYATVAAVGAGAPFVLGALGAAAAAALIGAALYGPLVRRLRGAGPMAQVLATFGLLFVATDALRFLFGADHLGLATRPLEGAVDVLGQPYPSYRLLVIAVGLAVFAALELGLARARLGAEIRAAVDDPETAAGLGVDVERGFFIAFTLGAALAGLAGAVATPIFAASPGMAVEVLTPSLAVVVLGGLGSVRGAMLGALVIGLALTLGRAVAPGVVGVLLYALLAGALVLRPEGLAPGRRA